MKSVSQVELMALDDLDIAIVRVDQEGVLTYMNQAARSLLDCPPGMRVNLRMLFPAPAEYEVAAATLQRRPDRSASYRTVLQRPWTGPAQAGIPVHIHAFPNAGANGQPDGAIALVGDLREELVRGGISGALATCADRRQLLDAVAAEVRTLVPFDEFHVTMISKSRTRMRELYTHGAKRAYRELVRWWTMPPFIGAMMPYRVPELCRVDAMRADPRYAALALTDPDTAAFFELGVREFLSVPVKHDNHVVGFVALYSYRDGMYDDDDLAKLTHLPLAEVVMAALYREHERRQQAILDLLQRMGQRAADIQKVAHALVTDLLTHFELEGWQHASIFQYDAQTDQIDLICQANRDACPLPAHFSMPARRLDRDGRQTANGPVAEAALEQRLANRPDTRRDSPRAALPGFDPHGAQLALPIVGEGTCWVLYVESRVMNAFAEEEIEPLQTLTDRAGAILAHSALFEVQSAVLASISDAVIETSADGRIRWCNAAAQAMLGIPPPGADGTRMADLAADAAAAAALCDDTDFYHREVSLRRPDDRPPLTVLLSASTPEHLGGRVYVVSDFTYQKEVQRLDELKEVFTQAALEGRVPLALANAWLEQHAADNPATAQDIDKIRRQMARADLPLERLLRLSTPPPVTPDSSLSDLGSALAATLAELPTTLRDAIDAVPATAPLPVPGEFNDLQFCIESMISFGLRTRPESKTLHVTARYAPPNASVCVEGDWIPNIREGVALGQVERWRRKTLYDVTIGDSMIERIVTRAGGRYVRELDRGLLLEIVLPLRTTAGAMP